MQQGEMKTEGNPEEKKHVLVYCHPKKIKEPTDHFLYDEIIELSEPGAKIETVDISGLPNHKEDAFSASFISQHQDEYDLVFLPDCAGMWRHQEDTPLIYYNERDSYYRDRFAFGKHYRATAEEAQLRRIMLRNFVVHRIGSMVKLNGKLAMAKFMKEGFLPFMIKEFEKQGWDITEQKLKDNSTLLIATKTVKVPHYPSLRF
jgi:hypothetical protein